MEGERGEGGGGEEPVSTGINFVSELLSKFPTIPVIGLKENKEHTGTKIISRHR